MSRAAERKTWFAGAGEAAVELGVSDCYLRRAAREGVLPAGSVLATHGGRRSYDIIAIKNWMMENEQRFTRASRMQARA